MGKREGLAICYLGSGEMSAIWRARRPRVYIREDVRNTWEANESHLIVKCSVCRMRKQRKGHAHAHTMLSFEWIRTGRNTRVPRFAEAKMLRWCCFLHYGTFWFRSSDRLQEGTKQKLIRSGPLFVIILERMVQEGLGFWRTLLRSGGPGVCLANLEHCLELGKVRDGMG